MSMVNSESSAPATEEQIVSLLKISEDLKSAGNLKLKEGRNSEALSLYSQGIEAGNATKDERAKPVLSQLYGNRGHIKLLTNDFVGVVEDCRMAISLAPNNFKAYWRAARASLSLELYKQAVDFAEKGVCVDPQNEELCRLLKLSKEKYDNYLSRRTNERSKQIEEEREFEERGVVKSFTQEEVMAAQDSLKDLNEQFYMIQQQIGIMQGEKVKGLRTVEVLKSLEEDEKKRKIFTTCGKSFVSSQKKKVVSDILRKIAEIENKNLPELEVARNQILNRKNEAEKNWREIVKFLERVQKK